MSTDGIGITRRTHIEMREVMATTTRRALTEDDLTQTEVRNS
jgi:hypothetical protein